MSNDKVWWMWLFLFPFALVAYIVFDIAEDRRISRVRKQIRKERNRRYLYGGFDEFDWWQDNQGL